MKEREEKLIIIGTILIISVGILTNIFVKNKEAKAAVVPEFRGSWSCIAETKMCPNGKTVSRVGPYCHFEMCE